jgi:hypothetical protein
MRSASFIFFLFISFHSFTQKGDSTATKGRLGVNIGSGVNFQSLRVNEANYPSQNFFFSLGLTYTRYISKKWEISADMMNNFGTIKNEFQINNTSHKYESDFVSLNIPLNIRYNLNKINNLFFLPHFVQVGPSINMLNQSFEDYKINNSVIYLGKKQVLVPDYRIKIGSGYVFSTSELLFRTELNYYIPLKSSNSIEKISSFNFQAFNINLIIENRLTRAQLKERRKNHRFSNLTPFIYKKK